MSQTYDDLEIIVVDDGSEVAATVENLGGDSRLRVIRHDQNRGVGAARNTGVQAAKGEVLAFLDSDDFWLPEKLAVQMKIYEAQPDKENIFCYSTYFYEEKGKWIPEPFEPIGKNQAVSDYLFIYFGDIHTSTWLASRRLFDQHPFCEELYRHQDWDLLLDCAASGVRFVHCPMPTGVRTADLRKDRLSTSAVTPMRRLFLDRNTGRMTKQSSVLMEAAYAELDHPDESFWRKHVHQISFFLKSSQLTLTEKVGLLFAYVESRLLFKTREKLRQQAPRNVGFDPIPPP